MNLLKKKSNIHCIYMYNPYPKKYFEIAKKKARAVGVEVKRSTNKDKKLDVYKEGEKVATIGSAFYEDFNIHKDLERRRRYQKRFQKTRNKVGTPSYYADKILW